MNRSRPVKSRFQVVATTRAEAPRRALALITVSIVLAACSGSSSAQPARPAAEAGAAAAAQQPSTEYALRALPDFSPLVERYGPAVVNVEVIEKSRSSAGGISPNDPFYEFFRRFGVPGPEQSPHGNMPPARGAGSGFIVSGDGYILTNTHVVENADEVTVRLTDRREYQAKVIGADQRTDVAVIKINASGLPTVKLGDPSRIKPGQWVLAIGSPFGFENSATAGIVSAIARSLPSDNSSYVPFIQTDVAVNPGNSGGPLFNLAGEVIGINSQIFSRTGGYMGVSFAIPIDVARNVQEQLIRTGRVVRGRIGVTIQDLNAQLAESFGLDRPHGALVSSVEPDSPAAKAGLITGDVILSVNGHLIEHYGELSGSIQAMKPGTEAALQVWRGGQQQGVNVKIAELKEQQQVAKASGGPRQSERPEAQAASQLGLTVRQLEPGERERVQTSGNLVVQDVTGPAAAAGMQPGDIILGVNGKRVHSAKELQDEARASGKNAALLIERDGAQSFVPLRVGP
jgi:serine protease Do